MKKHIIALFITVLIPVLCAAAESDGMGMGRPAESKVKKNVVYNDKFVKAAESADFRLMADMLKNGAKIDSKMKDDQEMTGLMKACDAGNTVVAYYLVEKGANVNEISRFGFTALMFAAQSGNKDLVEYLIKKGADVNKVGHMWATALRWAEKKEIRELLVKNGAK